MTKRVGPYAAKASSHFFHLLAFQYASQKIQWIYIIMIPLLFRILAYVILRRMEVARIGICAHAKDYCNSRLEEFI
jgi:hypothetical protein